MTPIPSLKAKPTALEPQNKRSTPIGRHMRNPRSRKAAIGASCWLCMGGDGSVGITRMIRECSSPGCALFRLRPYQKKKASL